MNRNIGPEDRVVRIVIGIALAIVLYMSVLTGTAAVVAGIIGAYALLSGLAARCLIYKPLGIDTSIQEQPYSTTDDRAFGD